MQELINVSYENNRPTVLGRELHAMLEVRTAYKDWFPRMCEYGFTEGTDFSSILSESTGGRPATDHQLTIDMAKEICMLQRSERGKQCRQYFLEVEKRWNSPEAVMARALQLANEQLAIVRNDNSRLTEEVAVQNQLLAEMKPKVTYYNIVLDCKDAIPVTVIAKDWGWSAKRMNHFLGEIGVQYRVGKTWVLYAKYQDKGYTATKTFTHPSRDSAVNHSEVHTYWTQAGRLFIYNKLKEHGYLPDVEKE